MESKTKVFITFGVLIVLVFGLYYFSNWFSLITGYVLGEDEKTKLAECLADKGAVLYISDSCIDCEAQLDVFTGSSRDLIRTEVCEDVENCDAIGGVPAWKINNNFYYGSRSLEELIQISACEI